MPRPETVRAGNLPDEYVGLVDGLVRRITHELGDRAMAAGTDADEVQEVVVTGFGPVTSVATGREAFWEGVLAGKSGIRLIESFDTSVLTITKLVDDRGSYRGSRARPGGRSNAPAVWPCGQNRETRRDSASTALAP
jgi:hypothetical protein